MVVSSSKQSNLQGMFNILLTAVGVGVLSLPKAMALSGWLIGFPMLLAFGLLSVYLCILLDQCMHLSETKGLKVVKYEEIGAAAFGTYGRLAALIPLHLSLTGCCAALMTLLASNTAALLPESVTLSTFSLVWIWGGLMLALVWMPTMKHIGYVSSTVGVAAIAAMCLSVIVAGFSRMASSEPRYEMLSPSIAGLGTAFACLTFAFAVTCTVPTIIRDLENRQDAPKVLLWGLMLTLAVYSVIALSGYLGWGSAIRLPIHEILDAGSWCSTVCRVSLIVACACHYAVMLHPSCRELEDLFGVAGKPLMRTLVRTVLALATFLLASLVEKLDTYVAILGSVTFAAIHSFLPPLFYLRLRSLNGKVVGKFETAGLVVIMLVTICGGACGVMSEFGLLKVTS
jgi:amino acid permease